MVLHKVLKYLALVIGVIGLIFLGRIVFAGDDAIKDSADLQSSLLNPFMWIAYIVFGITVLLVVIFVIKGLFTGNIRNTLISIAAFAIVVIVSYVLADGQAMTLKDGSTLSASGSKWVSAGLIAFYIMAVLAILSMVFTGIRKLTK